jgi:RNA 2',3'-cyclic 3'-phosphodiesterase
MAPPAAERPPAPRARLFVALTLPAGPRAALAQWAGRVLGGDPALRLVPAEYLHVTLAFVGARPESDVVPIATAVARAASGRRAPLLTPKALAALPVRRPRVLALDLGDDGDGSAAALQAAAGRELAAAGVYEPEARPFRAHVTVARVRKGARPRPLYSEAPPLAPFHAPEVVLYRSELRPDGARYSALASTPLTAERA